MEDTRKFLKEFGEASLRGGLPAVVTNVRTFPEGIMDRIKKITSLPEHYFCSPIGLIPKRVDGIVTGWRTIFDLSCPEAASVNDGIPKEYGTISYESLNDSI
jgi:hypothetical protein